MPWDWERVRNHTNTFMLFNVYGERDEMRVWAFHFLGLPSFNPVPLN